MLPTYIPTQKVEAKNGIVYAYRRLGPPEGVPLVLHMHVGDILPSNLGEMLM